MIPLWFKITIITICIVIVISFITKLWKDQKICQVCGKRMWFWQEVRLRPYEKPAGWRKITVYEPINHIKCEENEE